MCLGTQEGFQKSVHLSFSYKIKNEILALFYYTNMKMPIFLRRISYRYIQFGYYAGGRGEREAFSWLSPNSNFLSSNVNPLKEGRLQPFKCLLVV